MSHSEDAPSFQRKSTVNLIISITLVLVTSLQVAAFSSDNSTRQQMPDSNFLGLLQQFFLQLMGLYVTLIPTFRLNIPFTFFSWIGLLSIANVIFGLLSIVLYPYLKYGAAWAPLIGFFGSVAQVLVVMQQIEGMAATAAIRHRSR